MKDNKKYYMPAGHSNDEAERESIWMVMMKSLVVCFAISIVLIIAYSLLLSFTAMSDASMSMITQIIVILSIAISSAYGTKKIRRKGWIFGSLIGLIFTVVLIPLSMVFGQPFVFDKFLIAKLLMGGAVGAIGGIIGVNLN